MNSRCVGLSHAGRRPWCRQFPLRMMSRCFCAAAQPFPTGPATFPSSLLPLNSGLGFPACTLFPHMLAGISDSYGLEPFCPYPWLLSKACLLLCLPPSAKTSLSLWSLLRLTGWDSSSVCFHISAYFCSLSAVTIGYWKPPEMRYWPSCSLMNSQDSAQGAWYKSLTCNWMNTKFSITTHKRHSYTPELQKKTWDSLLLKVGFMCELFDPYSKHVWILVAFCKIKEATHKRPLSRKS